MNQPSLPRVSRRTVVSAVGVSSLAVGVTAGPTGLSAAADAPALSVGVLLPGRGDRLLRADLGRGLRHGLQAGGLRAELSTRVVPGGYDGLSARAAELVSGGARVLVASVTDPAADRLRAWCADQRVGLVVAGAGAHVTSPHGPAALTSTLQVWQSALTLGQYAARHLGRTLHAVVAVPDAGYDSVFAVRRGFVGGGGRVVGLSMTHGHPGGDGVGDAVAAVRASGAAVVAVSATGARAAAIITALRQGGVRARILLDAPVLEQPALRGLRAAAGCHAVGPAVSAGDAALAADLRRRAGGGDAFLALGYDTGLLLAEAARRRRGRPWSRLAQLLAGASVAGVHGEQRVHPRLGTVSTPLVVTRASWRSGSVESVPVVRRGRVLGVAPAMAVLGDRESAAYVNEYATT